MGLKVSFNVIATYLCVKFYQNAYSLRRNHVKKMSQSFHNS